MLSRDPESCCWTRLTVLMTSLVACLECCPPDRNLALNSDFQFCFVFVFFTITTSLVTQFNIVSRHVPSSMQNVLPSLALSPDDENEEEVTIQEKEKMINISYELAAEASKRSKVVAGTCARSAGRRWWWWCMLLYWYHSCWFSVNSADFIHVYFILQFCRRLITSC